MTDLTIDAGPAEAAEEKLPFGLSRRKLFVGAGLAAAAGVVAACGDDDDGGGGALEEDPTDGDVEIAEFAASLELLAVNTYGAALEAATAGSLGAVPPAVAEFVTVAMAQHQEALTAWNGVVGEDATETPEDLQATVTEMFGAVTDVTGAARLALLLEQIAADTYLDAIGKLESTAGVALAGSILPIARQHQSILLFVLGEYPVPEVFATTEQSAVPG